MKKYAFVWYTDNSSSIYPNWRDGLRGAMEQIEKKGHKVGWFFDKTTPDPEEDWDAIILWGDSECPFIHELYKYSCKKAICLTTNPSNVNNLRQFDVVLCESDPVLQQVIAGGANGVKAFGTDTDFYKPQENAEKDIEYFYPATFSPWKLQSEIAHLRGRLLCVGTIQPDGVGEWEACRETGVRLKEGYFPAAEIRDYYNRTQKMIIPAIHGSERTLLEALAMGVVPEITHPEVNIKLASLLQEYKDSGLTPREFVLKNYSHKKYAKTILTNI